MSEKKSDRYRELADNEVQSYGYFECKDEGLQITGAFWDKAARDALDDVQEIAENSGDLTEVIEKIMLNPNTSMRHKRLAMAWVHGVNTGATGRDRGEILTLREILEEDKKGTEQDE